MPDGKDSAVHDPSGSTAVVNLPKSLELKDPLSADLWAWLLDFQKATKALRVYAENNEMFQRFVDRAFNGLTRLLERVPELSISVREDRFLYGKDPVHINADRDEGIPFTFYRNAFRRLTFVRGMTRDELIAFMRTIITDYSSFDYAGEDLVTALWRQSLPHLRYLTIDSLGLDPKKARNQHERDDIVRIQGSIEDIVAAIYRTNAPDEDIVAGVTITKEDLEALKEIRKETDEDLDLLDQATARAITDIPPGRLEAVRSQIEADNHDALTRRMLDILVKILFREDSARASGVTIELLQQLFDSLVLGYRFAHATELITRLRESANQNQNLQEMHIALHLLKLFASEARVVPVLNAFNEGFKSTSIADMVGFLRALGPSIAPVLLNALDTLTSPAHRRVICDLIVEFGVPELYVLQEKARTGKWFVVRDILHLAQRYPLDRLAALVHLGLHHEHPKVRQYAVGMLRGYGRGLADRLLVERIRDTDLEVRMTAVRVAASRRTAEAKAALESVLTAENAGEREPRELRLVAAAYANIAGADSVALLDKLLNPGFFARLKSTELQIAAAIALGTLPQESAQNALHRGARTLNSKVREACRRSLSKDKADATDSGVLRIPGGPTPNPLQKLPALESVAQSIILESSPYPGTAVPEMELELGHRFAAEESGQWRAGPADLDFTIQSPDTLANAPAFTLEQLTSMASAEALNLHKPRPAMPRVEKPHAAKEAIPLNLPPAPPPTPKNERTPLPEIFSTPNLPPVPPLLNSNPPPLPNSNLNAPVSMPSVPPLPISNRGAESIPERVMQLAVPTEARPRPESLMPLEEDEPLELGAQESPWQPPAAAWTNPGSEAWPPSEARTPDLVALPARRVGEWSGDSPEPTPWPQPPAQHGELVDDLFLDDPKPKRGR